MGIFQGKAVQKSIRDGLKENSIQGGLFLKVLWKPPVASLSHHSHFASRKKKKKKEDKEQRARSQDA